MQIDNFSHSSVEEASSSQGAAGQDTLESTHRRSRLLFLFAILTCAGTLRDGPHPPRGVRVAPGAWSASLLVSCSTREGLLAWPRRGAPRDPSGPSGPARREKGVSGVDVFSSDFFDGAHYSKKVNWLENDLPLLLGGGCCP